MAEDSASFLEELDIPREQTEEFVEGCLVDLRAGCRVRFRFFRPSYYEGLSEAECREDSDQPVVRHWFSGLFRYLDSRYREEWDSLGLSWKLTDWGYYEVQPFAEYGG